MPDPNSCSTSPPNAITAEYGALTKEYQSTPPLKIPIASDQKKKNTPPPPPIRGFTTLAHLDPNR